MSSVPRPTLRGAAALLAFAFVVSAAGVTGTPELAPLAVLIGTPLVAAPWVVHRRARRARSVVELHAHTEPASVEVGSEMSVVFSITNRASRGASLPPLGLPATAGRWRIRGTGAVVKRDRWAPTLGDLVMLPTPMPGRTGSCRLAAPTRRRGVIELPRLTCWTYDGLGLFGAPGPRTPVVHAVVHPVPIDPGLPTAGAGASRAGEEVDRAAKEGRGIGDLEGLRPYVAGDRLSLLHWPAKARYGAWFVREFSAEGASAVPILLDDRVGVHRKADFERLVSAVLWTLDDAIQRGCPVLFLTLSGRSTLLEPSDQGRTEAWLLLAEIQPSVAGWGVTRSVPGDAVLLTTQTGAERLGGASVRSAGPEGAPPFSRVGFNASQVVVV